MNALLYELMPGFVHTLIRALTGWRLVRIERKFSTQYQWSKKYPIT